MARFCEECVLSQDILSYTFLSLTTKGCCLHVLTDGGGSFENTLSMMCFKVFL